MSLAAFSFLLAACEGEVSSTPAQPLPDQPFLKVSKDALTVGQGGSLTGGAQGVSQNGEEHFYVAVNKNEIAQGSRWFFSAYLSQWQPSEVTPMQSLGTRVVSFKVQNGKLFVFDVADGKAWSDTLDPKVVIEAWPIVTDYAAFNALPGASNYVLFDPAAGLNRFSFVSDAFAGAWVRFQTDLTYLSRFRDLPDGVAFDEIFTGYTETPDLADLPSWSPFRASGTLSMALRRYSEGAGFTPRELVANERFFFGSGNLRYVKDEAKVSQYTVKWNLHPGMQPIQWRISRQVMQLQNDPRLAGVDVIGAITRGVEGWNDVLGYPVFKVVPTGSADEPGDDEKNFIVVDPNPGAGLAFANWRENPNTGEIRGASVYFSAAFVEEALGNLGDAGLPPPIDAGTPPPSDAGTPPPSDAGTPPPADAGTATAPCAPSLVISQLSGSNTTSSAFNQDWVELHNRTDQPIALDGLSLQYGAATSTTWQVFKLTGTVNPGGFFLIATGTAVDGGNPLPAADLTATLNLSAAAGKVALVDGVTALSGACPSGAPVIDLVGYGATNCAANAPSYTSSQAAVRTPLTGSGLSCNQSNNPSADFQVGTASPRTSATAASACTCVAPAIAGGPTPSLPNPAGLSAPPAVPSTGLRVTWNDLGNQDSCGFAPKLDLANIPGGMTPKQYVEAVLTEAVLHEIGHTLGLRHNFEGSLGQASVMDYVNALTTVPPTSPLPYDVAAVRYLYAADAAPTQAFCTDEDRYWLAQCDIFDVGADPLTTDVAPTWTAVLHGSLTGGNLTYGDIWRLSRYVRGPVDETQRLAAFNALMGETAPPLSAATLALGTNAGPMADLVARVLLSNLFLDDPMYRDPIQVDPSVNDQTFRLRVIEVAKNILIDSDSQRSFESRRVAVDVLKRLQALEALQALNDARPVVVAQRANYNNYGQSAIDDLVRRIDLATNPYFTH